MIGAYLQSWNVKYYIFNPNLFIFVTKCVCDILSQICVDIRNRNFINLLQEILVFTYKEELKI